MDIDILKNDGSFNIIEWKSKGKTFKVIGSKSGGWSVWETIDSIKCIETEKVTKHKRNSLKNIKV